MVRSLSRKSSSALLGGAGAGVDHTIPPLPTDDLFARIRQIELESDRLRQCSGDRIICGKDGQVCQHSPCNHYQNNRQTQLSSKTWNFPIRDQSLNNASRAQQSSKDSAARYCKPFCQFLTDNPTTYHVVAAVARDLEHQGYKELNERDSWLDTVSAGNKYYVRRNGSTLIAFAVGDQYKSGNGAAVIAGHVDSLALKLKPVTKYPTKAGYLQLGVAMYGAPNSTWWDRDLGIAGRVLVREGDKINVKLVRLDGAIAKIPTLAPHFGRISEGPFNDETQTVPIVGLESSEDDAAHSAKAYRKDSFVAQHPPRLVKAIARELGIHSEADYDKIVSWDLEMFDTQPATTLGLDKEFITAGRIDDRLCSWAAAQALINSTSATDSLADSSIIRAVALFDNEEVGSLSRQGARSNFLKSTLTRAVSSLSGDKSLGSDSDLMSRTYANSFVVSSDVTHAINPNFLSAYNESMSARLNTGMAVDSESNLHMTTDGVSMAIMRECASRIGHILQPTQKRNDVRGGGTIGPMTSAATGIRSIDAGMPQLGMHSIRATTGSLDPGLGVQMYQAVYDEFESVDKLFR